MDNTNLKPITIETPYGVFKLDKSLSWFDAEVKIKDYSLLAYLETDEDGGETAEDALKVFLKTAENIEEFDKKNKEYAAENLLDLANEWQSDREEEEGELEEITKETFMEAMSLSEMTVSPWGEITLFYDDGDMFWGHSIVVVIEADGTIDSADIAG